MADSLRVGVIGAGLMGSQIGCEYALGGHRVTFVDKDPERSRRRVEEALELACRVGLADSGHAAAVLGEVAFAERISALDSTTELVVEAVPENLLLKRDVLISAAETLPQAILASNTATIPLTEIGNAIRAPERTLGTHYWNPPLLMPPVEVIRGESTRQEIVDRVRELLEALGKEPLVVNRDVPGFVWNRLQIALLREVLWLVEQKVATPQALDAIVRSGLARRFRYIGPFETIALGGVDDWTWTAENLCPVLSNATDLGDLGRWLADYTDDDIEAARSRRDEGLAEELNRERRHMPG